MNITYMDIGKKKRSYTLYTKEQIALVASLWDGNTIEEIAQELGLDNQKVQYLAKQLRIHGESHGFVLPKKKIKGSIQVLVEEVLTDLGYIK